MTTIDENQKLVENYLNGKDDIYIKKFVNDINKVIIEPTINKYKLFESVLKHELFTKVLAEFRKSDVLINACKAMNKNAVKWLLTMDINYGVQDDLGMTALMYSAKQASLDFVVEKMIKTKGEHLHLKDYNGNNVLFHATHCPDNLNKLLKSSININELNNDHESLLLYCSRYNKTRSFDILHKNKVFDPNLSNCVGKTIAMYLVEHARFRELKSFVKNNNIDPNYVNKFGESLVSVYVKKYYQYYIGNIGEVSYTSNLNYITIKNFALTLKTLIDLKCNFNVRVDKDGNTPIMVFLMIKDYITSKYLLDKCDIDLSITNNHGLNASCLYLFMSDEIISNLKYNTIRYHKTISLNALKSTMRENRTFDKQYTDYSDDITVNQNIKPEKMGEGYPIKKEYAQLCQQFIMEVFYPNAGSEVYLGNNTHRKESGNNLAEIAVHLSTGGLGPI